MPGEVAAAAAAGAAGAAGAGAEGGQPGQQRQQGGFGQLLGMVVRMGVMWYFMNMMKVGEAGAAGGSPRAVGLGSLQRGSSLMLSSARVVVLLPGPSAAVCA